MEKRGSAKGERRGGRQKGTPNKATSNAKQAIANFVDGNSDRLIGWLERIEQEDGPQDAFKCFASLLEYHVPKLSRAEIEASVSLHEESLKHLDD